MKLKRSVPAPVAGAAVVPSDLSARLGRLYELTQSSGYVFGSPLAFLNAGQPQSLPRLVYFGPQISDGSPRLAILAGLGRHDRLAARAVMTFVEDLMRDPAIGQALSLSFFPVVNVLGLLGGAEERDLAEESWTTSNLPEIGLLAQDARLRSYQGFIRVITTADDEPSARLRSVLSPYVERSGIEVFSSADFDSWAVSFEALPSHSVGYGPLSLADDLPFAPFEVELALPAEWSQARADQQLSALLQRLVARYRSFLAYGQHL